MLFLNTELGRLWLLIKVFVLPFVVITGVVEVAL